jgi:transcription antitermination factor NusG
LHSLSILEALPGEFLSGQKNNSFKKYKMPENLQCWYAIYTRPRWEKKIAAMLEDRGYEMYCPLNKVMRQWSDRKKVILEPLFKGYVFVKVEEDKKWELLNINGIVNYVYWLGKPARIRENEIETIRKFLNEFSDVEVVDGVLPVNTAVRVKQGVLMNYRGIVLEIIGSKAKVKIESMGIQLSAVFDKKNLELVHGA